MAEFFGLSDTSLAFVAVLSAMTIGALSVWLLRRRWMRPKQRLWQLVVSYGGGMLVGGILALLFAVLAPSILGGVSLWVLPAMLIGMVVVALIVPMLPLPSGWSWQTAGCGLLLIFLSGCIVGGSVLVLWWGGVHGAPDVIPGGGGEPPFFNEQFVTPTPTPTATRSSATPTPTPITASPGATATLTATFTVTPTTTIGPTAPINLALPLEIALPLNIGTGDCGVAGWTSPFTIRIAQDGATTMIQQDTGDGTVGFYDTSSGKLNTAGAGAGWSESYDLLLTRDGENAGITGTYLYQGPGVPNEQPCRFPVSGEAPLP